MKSSGCEMADARTKKSLNATQARQWLFLHFLVVLMLSIVSFASEPQAPCKQRASSLPSVAQESYEEGLAAVVEAQSALAERHLDEAQGQWNLAIKYFSEAQKTAPSDEAVLFNLALAESKVKGRELRSIAWFHAYLAAVPNSPCASAIKHLLIGLQVQADGRFNGLIDSAKQVARNFRGNARDWALLRIADIQADHGDLSAAINTATLIRPRGYARASAFAHIAYVQAYSGDVSRAQGSLQQTCDAREDEDCSILYQGDKDLALAAIAVTQAGYGDTVRAAITASLIRDILRSHTLTVIAKAQHSTGLKQEGYRTLREASDFVNRFQDFPVDTRVKEFLYQEIGVTQALVGDVSGARATANLISDTDLVSTRSKKDIDQAIVDAGFYQEGQKLLAVKDFAGAIAAASRMTVGTAYKTLERSISDAQGLTPAKPCPQLDPIPTFRTDEPCSYLDARPLTQVWRDFVDSDLSKVLYTDFPLFVQSLTSSGSSEDIFDRTVHAADELSKAIRTVRWLSAWPAMDRMRL